LLHQLRSFPLRASAVVFQGSALAICGRSPVGKSALAAALVRKGALLLSDDLCAVDTAQARPHLLGGCTQVRLAKDVLEYLEIDAAEQQPTRAGHNRFAIPLPSAAAQGWPLRLLVHLTQDNLLTEPNLKRLTDLGSILPPLGLVYQYKAGQLYGNQSIEFQSCARIAQYVPRYRVERTRNLHQLDRCAELILELLEDSTREEKSA
jgi:hypothetical protein